MKVIALIFLSLVGWTASQAAPPAPFYASGNAFLRMCDPDGDFARSLPSDDRTTTPTTVCIMWLVGVVQGIGIEDQLRPLPIVSKQDKQRGTTVEELLEEAGKPAVTDVPLPNANICIPADATNMQYLRVVLAYMKSHPENLTRHAALLAIAASKTAWACPVKN